MLRVVALTLGLAISAIAARAQESPGGARPIDRAVLERTARRAEPDLAGRSDRLSQYLDAFRRELANDPRLSAFDVTAADDGHGGVRLSGVVEFAETRAGLGEYFSVLGFPAVDNQITTLPAADLGEKNLGFVIQPHALCLETPDEQGTVGTDCLFGEPLFLLREIDGYLHVHCGDGYLGYIPSEAVHRVTAAEFARYLDGPVALLKSDDKRPDGSTLPAGARLKWLRSTADGIIVQLPTGEEASLPNAITQVRDQPKSLVDGVERNARQLLGTPYLWGGKTSQGVDCSGLVQTSFAAVGVTMPRDANLQFHVGRLVGTRWCTAAMRRGDTMYFLGAEGRIRHTGIYLGDNQFIHAVSPVVTINSLDPADPNYDARRHASFAYARRLWD